MNRADSTGKRAGRARLMGEHFTHRYLWMVSETLRDRSAAEQNGDALLRLAALLFVYLAVECHMNYVGERLCPEQWADEREFFGRGKYRGTLGKLLPA